MAINYNVGRNVITVTGYTEATPCTFLDIYNADVAGAWGKVSRQCTSQFCFDAGLIIGDGSTASWFKDINKSVTYRDFGVPLYSTGYFGAMNIKANANCQFGNVMSAGDKIGYQGCTLYAESTGDYFLVVAEGSANLKAYGSMFGGGIRYGMGSAGSPIQTGNLIIWNSKIDFSLWVMTANNDLHRISVNRQQRANSYGVVVQYVPLTVSDIVIFGARDRGGLSLDYTGTLTFKNAFLRDNDYALSVWTYNGTYNCINWDTDTWAIHWGHIGDPDINRQYEFDLKVTDKDGTAISGVAVKIWDKDDNLVTDTTTNASGVIATQTLTYGCYKQAGGGTPTMQTPHTVQISKPGYQSYKKKFTVDEKMSWRIRLLQANPVQFLDNSPILQLCPESQEDDGILFEVI